MNYWSNISEEVNQLLEMKESNIMRYLEHG